MSYTTHVKGFDSFYTSVYETGEKWLKAALEEGGYEVTFMPNHLAGEEFPFTMEELKEYDLILASRSPRRRQLLADCGLEFSLAGDYEVIEEYPRDLPADEVAAFLSRLKSEAIRSRSAGRIS